MGRRLDLRMGILHITIRSLTHNRQQNIDSYKLFKILSIPTIIITMLHYYGNNITCFTIIITIT